MAKTCGHQYREKMNWEKDCYYINIGCLNFFKKFNKKNLAFVFCIVFILLISDPEYANYWQVYATSSSIVLDNVQSTSGTVTLTPFQITLSNFVVGSGTNKVLIVGVESSAGTVSGVTYGGVALTQVISQSNVVESEFWILKNPPSGTADIVVTMSGISTVVVGAYSFFGVDQTTPVPTTVTNSSTTNHPSTTIINNNAYSWLLDSVSIASDSLSGPTQTSRWNVDIVSAVSGASSSSTIISPNTSTIFGWTSGTVAHWAQIAIEVKPAQIIQSISDSINVNDAVTTSKTLQRSLTDSLTISDESSMSSSFQQSMTNSVILLDSISTSSSFHKSLLDSLTMVDTVTASKTSQQLPSDSISLLDSLTITKSVSKPLFDTISLSDSISTTKSDKQSFLDSFTLSDSLATKKSLSTSLSDSISFSDSVSTKRSTESLSDSVGLSDSVSVSRTNNQNVPPTSTGGGGISGSATSPSFSGSAFSESEYPLSLDGKNYKLQSYTNSIPTATFETGKPVKLSLLSFSNSGPDSIQHVALYTNLYGANSDISQSDTYIIYEKGQVMQVVDPHRLFGHVQINTTPVGNKLQIVFDIAFAKSMDKSNIVVRMWDAYRNSVDTKILNAWQIIQSTPEVQSTNVANQPHPTIIPSETQDAMSSIRKWGGYSPTSISDSQLLEDLGMSGTHIPSWFMKTTKWVVTSEIGQQDFLNALKYMHDHGMIT